MFTKNEINITKLNLDSSQVREEYSHKLRQFEDEFSYPLGSERFQISHGREGDYFSFFDQMGQTHYFVAEVNNKVVGAGCAVLRTSEDNKKYWYLCDFKITEQYRGQKILEKMLAKYFFQCVMKSRRVVAVNMNNGEIKDNGLVKKIQKMFWFFNIDVQWLNLHQWSLKELKEEKVNTNNIYTNIGRKDIVMNGKAWQLYHMAEPNDKLNKFKEIALHALPEEATVMCSVLSKEDKFSQKSLSGKGVVISAGMKNVKISTLEI